MTLQVVSTLGVIIALVGWALLAAIGTIRTIEKVNARLPKREQVSLDRIYLNSVQHQLVAAYFRLFPRKALFSLIRWVLFSAIAGGAVILWIYAHDG